MAKQQMNRNYATCINSEYITQQRTIDRICEELGLVAYRPEYHALSPDCNTVLIYTKADHEYNKQLEAKWRKLGLYPLESEYKCYLLALENTDINGCFSLRFMNRGKIDLRWLHFAEPIREAILQAMNDREGC